MACACGFPHGPARLSRMLVEELGETVDLFRSGQSKKLDDQVYVCFCVAMVGRDAVSLRLRIPLLDQGEHNACPLNLVSFRHMRQHSHQEPTQIIFSRDVDQSDNTAGPDRLRLRDLRLYVVPDAQLTKDANDPVDNAIIRVGNRRAHLEPKAGASFLAVAQDKKGDTTFPVHHPSEPSNIC